MSLFDSQAERAGWQRRAVRELAVILDSHRDLPMIVWSVGSMLVGHVSGLEPANEARGVFDAWRSVLALTEHSEITVGGGAIYLSAAADRNRVRVRLTATVSSPSDPDQVVPS